jgi:hypothetical protein
MHAHTETLARANEIRYDEQLALQWLLLFLIPSSKYCSRYLIPRRISLFFCTFSNRLLAFSL